MSMSRKSWVVAVAVLVGGIAVAPKAEATVTNATCGTIDCFEDSTGRFWMDLDTFFGTSSTVATMKAFAVANGFIVANGVEVSALLSDVDLDPAGWDDTPAGWSTAMGFIPGLGNGGDGLYPAYFNNHPASSVIWGYYDAGVSFQGWAWATDDSSAWTIQVMDGSGPGPYPAQTPEGGLDGCPEPDDTALCQDMGIWAYTDNPQTAVPEPASVLLIGSGLIGLRLRRRHKS